jgi:hypothetical protein
MYCSACGAAVAQGLSYCNHCGAKLGGERGEGDGKSSELRPEFLVSAMVGAFVLSLFGLSLLMLVMKSVLAEPFVLAITMLTFTLLLLLEGVLLWLLLRRTGISKAKRGAAPPSEQTTKELDAARARSLPEGVPSVTEQTTRAFDPVYVERKSK